MIRVPPAALVILIVVALIAFLCWRDNQKAEDSTNHLREAMGEVVP